MKVANLTVNLDARQVDEIMDEITKLKMRIARLENPIIVATGDVVQWRHDTMPDGKWRAGIAEAWDWERECWQVRDAEGFLVTVDPDDANILRAKEVTCAH